MGFNQAPALPYRNLGIVQDGDTANQAIEKDKYIIWKGGNYFAKTDILQGETFVVDTNLTAMPEGVINGIVDALNASLTPVTIWENQSTASFASQTIPFDISEYKMIMVYIVYGISVITNGGIEVLMKCSVGEGANVVIAQPSGAAIASRRYEIVSTGLKVYDGGYIYGTSYTSDNIYAAPFRILGFK